MSNEDLYVHSLLTERDKEIRKIYTRIVSESGINKKYLTRDFISKQIQKSPAPRFYIEPKHAANYVNAYNNGKLRHVSAIKRAMVLDLVEVYEEVRALHPNDPMSEIWLMVVRHPAKSFYLSPSRIIEIIYEYHDRKRVRNSPVK